MIITNINLFSFSVYRRSQRQSSKVLSKLSNEQSTSVQISISDDQVENNRGDHGFVLIIVVVVTW